MPHRFEQGDRVDRVHHNRYAILVVDIARLDASEGTVEVIKKRNR